MLTPSSWALSCTVFQTAHTGGEHPIKQRQQMVSNSSILKACMCVYLLQSPGDVGWPTTLTSL